METGQYSAGVTLLHERAQKLLTRPFVDNQSLGFPPLYFRHVIIRSNQFFSLVKLGEKVHMFFEGLRYIIQVPEACLSAIKKQVEVYIGVWL